MFLSFRWASGMFDNSLHQKWFSSTEKFFCVNTVIGNTSSLARRARIAAQKISPALFMIVFPVC